MASLKTRPRSPYWWIKCRDTKPGSPTFGKVIEFSTRLKVGVGPDTRKARELKAELTAAESKIGSNGTASADHWRNWVPAFFKVHCASPLSLSRNMTSWRNLELFFSEKNILTPRELSREALVQYPDWRSKPDKTIGKYKAGHNTMHTELKTLSLVMDEAVRRNLCAFNPVKDLGIKRRKSREKPELPEAVMDEILLLIDAEAEPAKTFLRNSFLIARYQGCRLRETFVNLDTEVFLEGDRGHINFRVKGNKRHIAPIHPKLIPLFQNLKAQGKTTPYEMPPNPSRSWFNFLNKTGIREKVPGACHHSLRVTVVTMLARTKVSMSKAMKYVGHASTTVHRSYQRLRPDDLDECFGALE